MSLETYTEPVAALLTYGDCSGMSFDDWDNYPEIVGLTAEHIPELIRMAIDPQLWQLWETESDRLEVWAPVHAWRALAQLHAEEAAAPLTEIFRQRDSDWVIEELPTVYRMIGPAAIPALTDYLTDPSHDYWARVTATDSLREIALGHPDYRDACIASMTRQLEAFEENPVELNDMIICDLIDLKAVEAAPVIEKVFAAERINEFVTGNWPLVQIELGLKQEKDFSPKELQPKLPEAMATVAKLVRTLAVKTRKPKGFGGQTSPSPKKSKKKKK